MIFVIMGTIGFGFYAGLRIDNARFVHEPRSFGDAVEYFNIAAQPVISREFWTGSKPPITSMVWKIAGTDPVRIFRLQLYFSIVAWTILASSFASVLQNAILKPIGFVTILTFSLCRDIFMWDPFLGSESLALSFSALFLAIVFRLICDFRWYKVGALLAVSCLLVFTRDTYAYLLLMAGFLILPLFWLTPHRLVAVVISGAWILLYMISTSLATAGLRPYRAVMMITALRIFPSHEYTEYFRAHGMPIDEKLVELSRNPQPGEKFAVNIALYYDAAQGAYRRWLIKQGQKEYLKFLWFYKADTLQNVFLETPQESFYPDVYYYTATGYRPIIKDNRISEIIYPTRFGLVFFLAATGLAAFMAGYALRERRTLWLAPILMILLTYPQAVLVWAGDANDIARHSIPHNVLLRLGVWMLLLLIADRLVPSAVSKTRSVFNVNGANVKNRIDQQPAKNIQMEQAPGEAGYQ